VDHETNIAQSEHFNPNFAAAADDVYAFAKGLWKKKFDADRKSVV